MKEKKATKQKKSFARALVGVTERAYTAIARSRIGRFFSAYSESEAALHDTVVARAWRKRRVNHGKTSLRKGVARAMDRSKARVVARKVLDFVSTCSLRTVGSFLLTTGLYYAIVHWLVLAVWQGGAVDPIGLFFALCALVLGAILLCANTSIGHAIASSVLGGWFLRSILGFSEDSLADIPREGRQTFVLTVPFGMLMGALTAFVGPALLFVSLLILLFALLIFSVPEAGVVLLILYVPFGGFVAHNTLWLALASLLVLAGYTFKLMRGTRAFRLEIQDLSVMALLLFALIMAFSAKRGKYEGAIAAASLMAIYFPAVNMLSTPGWLSRCRWALITSSTGAAMISILQFAIALTKALQGAVSFEVQTLGEVVRAGFADASVFAYFMVLAFPFALYGFLRTKTRHRVLAGLACVSIVVATALTFVQSAWLAIVVELIVTCLVYGKRFVPYMLGVLALIPGGVALMPTSWRAAVSRVLLERSDLSFSRARSVGEFATRVYFEKGEGFFSRGQGLLRLLFGLGEGGMETVCVLYTTLPPREMIQNFNFWMQGLADGGVLGVILPAIFFFLFLQNCLSIMRHARNMDDHVLALVGVLMLSGVLVLSAFRYAWYDSAALLAFFLVTSLITADSRYHRACDIYEEEVINTEDFVEVDFQIVDPTPVEPNGMKKERKVKKSKEKKLSAKQGGSQ